MIKLLKLNAECFFLRLHKAVSNPFLVKLYSYFEDSNFVYIVLEICRKRYPLILQEL